MKIVAVKFILFAQDMERAVAFWRGAAGLASGDVASPWWTELRFGDAIVALHGGGDGSFRPTTLSIAVEDIHEAAATLEAAGATVRAAPEDREGEPILLAELTDTEGNGFALTQRKPG